MYDYQSKFILDAHNIVEDLRHHILNFREQIPWVDTDDIVLEMNPLTYLEAISVGAAFIRNYHISFNDELYAYEVNINCNEGGASMQARKSLTHYLDKDRWKEINFDAIDASRYLIQSLNIGGRGYGKTFLSSLSSTKLPIKYVVNKNAAILMWDRDGYDKTIVKRAKDDKTDVVKAYLWAYFLRHSGLSRTKANKYLQEVSDSYKKRNKKGEKKNAKRD